MKFHRNDIIKFIVLDFLFSFKIKISPSLRNFFSILALCVCVCVMCECVPGEYSLAYGNDFFSIFFYMLQKKI